MLKIKTKSNTTKTVCDELNINEFYTELNKNDYINTIINDEVIKIYFIKGNEYNFVTNIKVYKNSKENRNAFNIIFNSVKFMYTTKENALKELNT